MPEYLAAYYDVDDERDDDRAPDWRVVRCYADDCVGLVDPAPELLLSAHETKQTNKQVSALGL